MTDKQFELGDYCQFMAKRRIKRWLFLCDVEAVVPWQPPIDLIDPNYPKASKKCGRTPFLLAT
jgi:hypothetical protein